jgi:ABC-type uncharacterized transport system permease subunit
LDDILFILAQWAYLLVAVTGLLGESDRPKFLSQFSVPCLYIGAVLHGAGLLVMAQETGGIPVHTPGASMATLGFSLVLGHLVIRRGPRMDVMSQVIMPMVVVLLALAQVLPNALRPSPMPEGSLSPVWIWLHIGMIFLGLGLLTLSYFVSLAYLALRRRLKQKRLEGLGRFPDLETLDRTNARLLLFGFAALSNGIALGGVWWAANPDSSSLDATAFATIGAWLWYAIAIQVRVVGGWRGKFASVISVIGFSGLLIALVIANFSFSGWHQ